MDEEERPVNVVVDCQGSLDQKDWTVTETPLTDAEWAEHRQRSAAVMAEQAAEAAERAAINAQVDEHPDPLVQLLARKAGYGS